MDDVGTIRYVLALALLVVMPPSIGFWFFVHPFIRFWRKLGAGWSYGIVGSISVLMMMGIALFGDRLLTVEYGTHYPLMALGLAILVAAGWMRRSVQKRLKNRILMGLPELDPEGHPTPLITDGPHGIIRHPRYVQLLLALLGWSLISNYLALYALFLFSIPALALVAALEERELRERYGPEWTEYARRVPMFLPRLERRRP